MYSISIRNYSFSVNPQLKHVLFVQMRMKIRLIYLQTVTIHLRSGLAYRQHYFQVVLPNLDEQSALLGLYEALPLHFKLVNHILILFKIYLYHSRDSGLVSINGLMSKIKETAKLELSLAPIGSAFYELYKSKWAPLNNLL